MKPLVSLVILMIAATANAQKQQAAAILDAHCSKCHPSKSDAWDAKDLASARAIGDSLLEQLAADTMPPGKLPKLTEAEKKTIRDWLAVKPTAPVAQSTTPAPQQKPRQFLDDAWVQKQIASDTQ